MRSSEHDELDGVYLMACNGVQLRGGGGRRRCTSPSLTRASLLPALSSAGPSVTCERKPAREASSSAWHAGCERMEERREERRVERREEACEEEERQLARSVGHTVWPRCRASSLKEGGGVSMSLREGEEEEGKTME